MRRVKKKKVKHLNMEEVSEVSWIYRVGCNACVGSGACESDLSGRKGFGCSGVAGPAADNASYMLQSF